MQILFSRQIAIELLKCSEAVTPEKPARHLLRDALRQIQSIEMVESVRRKIPDPRPPNRIERERLRKDLIKSVINSALAELREVGESDFDYYEIKLSRQLQDIARTALVVRYLLILKREFGYSGKGALDKAKNLTVQFLKKIGPIELGETRAKDIKILVCEYGAISAAWAQYKDIAEYCFAIIHYGVDVQKLLSSDGLREAVALYEQAERVRQELLSAKLVSLGDKAHIRLKPPNFDDFPSNFYKQTKNASMPFPCLKPTDTNGRNT